MAPKVSVLIPCYNCVSTLPHALESVLAQSFDDFQIIAVDDGSTDGTGEVLSQFAAMDSRVKPVAMEHGGIVKALNLGLDLCASPYVARMDGDDTCLPERLLLQSGHLDRCPEVGLVSGMVEYGGDREKNAGYAYYVDWINTMATPERIRLNRFVESPLAHPSVMFRRELVDAYGPYRDGDFPEDYELWLRFLEQGVIMDKVQEPVVVWNDPPDRLSRTDSRYDQRAFYRTKAGYLARWLEKNNALHPEVMIVGAGRTARKRAEFLVQYGVNITGYVDVDPKKIGHVIGGVPVAGRDDLPHPGKVFCVSYVGSRGARDDISNFLRSKGYALGRDFILAA